MAGQAMLEEIVRTIVVWIEDIEEAERTTMESNILYLCRRHVTVPIDVTDWRKRPWTEEHHWFGGTTTPPDWGVRLENTLFNIRRSGQFQGWMHRYYKTYGKVQTWEQFCGLSGTHRDLTWRDIIRIKNVGRKTTALLLKHLRSEGLEPAWADRVERYYGIKEKA